MQNGIEAANTVSPTSAKMLAFFKKLFPKKEETAAAPAVKTASPVRSAQVAHASTSISGVEVLSLSLRAILEKFTPDVRAQVNQMPDENMKVVLPVTTIMKQLPAGVVKMSLASLQRQAPPGIFRKTSTEEKQMVDVPLAEIFKTFDASRLKLRPDQRECEIPDMAGLFTGGEEPAILSTLQSDGGARSEGATAPSENADPASASGMRASLKMPQQGAPVVEDLSASGEPREPEQTLDVFLSDVTAGWPEAELAEVYTLPPGIQLKLPLSLLQAGIQRGSVTLTWAQILRSMDPAPTASLPIPTDAVFPLPLKVVAPKYFALTELPKPAAGTTMKVDTTLPDFFGFGTGAPKPAAAAPVSEPPAIKPPLPRPAVPLAPTLEPAPVIPAAPTVQAPPAVTSPVEIAPISEPVAIQPEAVAEPPIVAPAPVEIPVPEPPVAPVPAEAPPLTLKFVPSESSPAAPEPVITPEPVVVQQPVSLEPASALKFENSEEPTAPILEAQQPISEAAPEILLAPTLKMIPEPAPVPVLELAPEIPVEPEIAPLSISEPTPSPVFEMVPEPVLEIPEEPREELISELVPPQKLAEPEPVFSEPVPELVISPEPQIPDLPVEIVPEAISPDDAAGIQSSSSEFITEESIPGAVEISEPLLEEEVRQEPVILPAAPLAPVFVSQESAAPVLHTAQTLGALFNVPEKPSWTANELIKHTCQLPGVTGALIALEEGLVVAHQLPAGFSPEAFAAFMPQIFKRISRYVREMQLIETHELNIITPKGACQLFQRGKVFFAVIGRNGETIPSGVKLVAEEIANQNS